MGDPNAVTKYAQRLKARYDIVGKVFFVNNGTAFAPGAVAGADTSGVGESELQPFATIDYAIGKCTASRGDAIFVLPTHAETVTSAITLDVIGVQIIGLPGYGNKKPVVTVNGAVDAITITAANCRVSGLHMTIASTDAATALINVAAAYAKIDNIRMIPSVTSYNVVDCITLASGADDCLIENVRIVNTVVPVNSFLNIEAAVARLQVKGCRWYGDCVTAGVIDAATATFVELEDNVIATIGTTIPAVTLDNNPAPIVAIRNGFLGTHTTIASNANLGNLARLVGNFVLEATDGSVSATPIIPAYDTE